MDNALSTAGRTLIDWINRLSGWILLIAIGWLCWGIARIVWLLIAPPQAPNLPVVPLQVRQAPVINATATLSVFENAESQSKPTQPPPNIKLSGVILGSPSSLSSAMLDINGVMANYRIGDELADSGYILEDVSWDEVVIRDRNNRDIVVKMPPRMGLDQSELNQANVAGSNNAQMPSPSSSVENGQDSMNGSAQMQQRSTIQSGANQQDQDQDNNQTATQDPKSAIDTAVNELKQNPAGYLSRMGVMSTGEGYEVTDAMPDKLRKRLGLQPGDRVLSVNGQNVGSNPDGDADLLNQVKQSGQATIEVKRGDQTLTVRQQF